MSEGVVAVYPAMLAIALIIYTPLNANSQTYGQRLGVDLEGNPELALDATVAAEVLVLYFCDHHIPEAARRQDWRYVREAVNGGYNGWDHFIALVGQAKQVLAA